jgi:hypothetical protein
VRLLPKRAVLTVSKDAWETNNHAALVWGERTRIEDRWAERQWQEALVTRGFTNASSVECPPRFVGLQPPHDPYLAYAKRSQAEVPSAAQTAPERPPIVPVASARGKQLENFSEPSLQTPALRPHEFNQFGLQGSLPASITANPFTPRSRDISSFTTGPLPRTAAPNVCQLQQEGKTRTRRPLGMDAYRRSGATPHYSVSREAPGRVS